MLLNAVIFRTKEYKGVELESHKEMVADILDDQRANVKTKRGQTRFSDQAKELHHPHGSR
jgi:hypothetical protein